jgi:very-short-patch-repair endonuclease
MECGGGEIAKMLNTRDPNPSGVVFLQHVNDFKLEQARVLRKEMTPAERIFWERVRRNKILGLQFRRQQPIEGFIADFYCNAARCVIEIDGGVHEVLKQRKIDEHRRKVFESRGLAEIRFTNKDILDDIEKVIRNLEEFLKERLLRYD